MSVTYHVVVPFARDDEGALVPAEPMEAPNSGAAVNRARAAIGKHVGAIAFSRTGDPDSGDFGDAKILATFGEVDRNMLME